MKIILAADHGGFQHKTAIANWLDQAGYDLVDAGAFALDADDDFPDFVYQAIKLWRQDPDSKLLLWCRSGVGVDIAANRFAGIYCGLALNVEQVTSATRDDHLNVLAIPADYLDLPEQQAVITAFLNTPQGEAERFARRLQKIETYSQL